MINKITYDGSFFYIKYNDQRSNEKCKNMFNKKCFRGKQLKIEIIEDEIKEGIEIIKYMNSLKDISRRIKSKVKSKSSKNSTSETTISVSNNNNNNLPITQERQWYIITDFKDYEDHEV